MKKLMLLVAAFSLAACTSTSNPAGPGMIVSMTKAPIGAGPARSGPKTGKACAQSFLGLVAMGDSSVETAKKNGGIKTVSTVDVENFSVLVYGESCTIVKGQ
ncbi:MAG: TRL-like family protein [Alphaproteobacteria bacterium]|nr:TRL-like family protein [Alphaproteobacteria bacterium]MBN2780266.1 TRL-like family protein [Alphaproteobacteria bacterium]